MLVLNARKLRHCVHMASSHKRGALLVLEGLDRVGKSTQAKRLALSLEEQGHSVESIRFPDRSTPIGQKISLILSGEMNATPSDTHSFFSQNRWELFDSMRSKLLSGINLVVDRYAHSGCAYTTAKGAASLDECMSADDGLLAPDAAVYLRMSASDAAVRGGYGNEVYEEENFQRNVAACFDSLADRDLLLPVDAAGSEDEVASRVYAVAAPALHKCSSGAPLRLLWDYRENLSVSSSHETSARSE
jgi:dTMP kinase